MADDFNDDQFQKEVLELFTLEAHEWLGQIKAALRELEIDSDPGLRPKLLDIIHRGITNLGGSAATVDLPAIQQLTFGLLPLLDTLRSQGLRGSAKQLAALRDGLERLTRAVQQVANRTQTATGQPTETTKEIAEPLSLPSSEPSTPPSISPQPPTILEALRELQQVRARSLEPTRNLVELVIRRAEGDSAQGRDSINGQTVQRILRELDGLDEEFLSEVQRMMPVISKVMSDLKAGDSTASMPDGNLEPVLRQVQSLHEAARAVNAAAIMRFLHGLHTFLTVIAHRGTSLVSQRLEAVTSRIGAVVPMAQQWVEVGRVERAAIGKVLPS
ncbi:MAG TPA: Hpt domain-containing protein [Nitrospiraceae bacterium]|nr:Hpt domain-containing protein [Nitrospiraceae bacterium]